MFGRIFGKKNKEEVKLPPNSEVDITQESLKSDFDNLKKEIVQFNHDNKIKEKDEFELEMEKKKKEI